MIYHECITTASLSTQAYDGIRRAIVRLDFAPGDVLREDELQDQFGIGRTPIREALQRLARDQFVTVIPRRGMFVSSIDIDDLAMLYETRAVMEPYAARLAAERGTVEQWDEMAGVIERSLRPGLPPEDLLEVDRRCHELIWEAAGNRFLTDTLDAMYAQSDRVWHLYLADVYDTRHAVDEHIELLDLLRSGDPDDVRGGDGRPPREVSTTRCGPPSERSPRRGGVRSRNSSRDGVTAVDRAPIDQPPSSSSRPFTNAPSLGGGADVPSAPDDLDDQVVALADRTGGSRRRIHAAPAEARRSRARTVPSSAAARIASRREVRRARSLRRDRGPRAMSPSRAR